MKFLISALVFIASFLPAAAQLTFSGNFRQPVTDTPDASSGLAAVYTLDSTDGVTASYTAATASTPVKWYRFSSLGGGYAQEIPSSRVGNVSSVSLTNEDMGYIVEEGTSRRCFWIVNYENHICSLQHLAISPEQDCLTASLDFTGQVDRIIYYTVNGVPRTLSRGLNIEYTTQTYDADRGEYVSSLTGQQLEYISGQLHLPAPLCATEFLLTGDRFQAAWGTAHTIESPTYTPTAVEAVTTVTQTSRQIDNEQKDNDASQSATLGGSAPVEIEFLAAVSEAAIYREWQFAADPQFDIIDIRINSTEATRVFNEYGTVYARFIAGDNDGKCEWISQTYVINIGESRLECPNAFSPGSSEGSNDEWKVSYKSIISFDCHIFNRWGLEVAHLTDPSQGWDGRYNGKLVKSGVFYYVIQAEGADGKQYKLSGDINVINSRKRIN